MIEFEPFGRDNNGMKLGIWLAAVMLALVGCSAPKPLKVGVIYSSEGNNRNYEEPMLRAAEIAIKEINSRGEHCVELIAFDAKSQKELYIKGVEQLSGMDNVDLLVGDYRQLNGVNRLKVLSPFDYMGETGENIIFWGNRRGDRLEPGIGWAIRTYGKRVYYIGEDSEEGRKRLEIAKEIVESRGGHLVGEVMGAKNRGEWISVGNAIEKTEPSCIICDLKGALGLDMLKVFISYHYFTREYPRIFTSYDESMLNHIKSVSNGVNILVKAQSLRKEEDERLFAKEFEKIYGKGRLHTKESFNTYTGLLKWMENGVFADRKHTAINVMGPGGIEKTLWTSRRADL